MSDGGAGKGDSAPPARPAGVCPHDGSPLFPLSDTPRWFRCGAEGWKHYFYRDGAGELIDVDTDRPAPAKAPRRREARHGRRGTAG